MGFLARRTTPPVPVPATRPSSPPTPAETARIRWHQSDHVGWKRLPAPARDALDSTGHTTGTALAAGTWAPVTRRDPAGRFWHDTDAWWISASTLLLVRARAALRPHGTNTDGRLQLQHTAHGLVQATTHQLTGPVPSSQRWARPQGPTDPAQPNQVSRVRLTERAVEVLPRAVQTELGTPSGQIAIRHYPAHGGYHDQVLAFRRISPTDLIAVAAVREAGAYPDPEAAIDAADWHITTHRARVGPATQTDLPW